MSAVRKFTEVSPAANPDDAIKMIQSLAAAAQLTANYHLHGETGCDKATTELFEKIYSAAAALEAATGHTPFNAESVSYDSYDLYSGEARSIIAEDDNCREEERKRTEERCDRCGEEIDTTRLAEIKEEIKYNPTRPNLTLRTCRACHEWFVEAAAPSFGPDYQY